jgi:hypothetical protein
MLPVLLFMVGVFLLSRVQRAKGMKYSLRLTVDLAFFVPSFPVWERKTYRKLP